MSVNNLAFEYPILSWQQYFPCHKCVDTHVSTPLVGTFIATSTILSCFAVHDNHECCGQKTAVLHIQCALDRVGRRGVRCTLSGSGPFPVAPSSALPSLIECIFVLSVRLFHCHRQLDFLFVLSIALLAYFFFFLWFAFLRSAAVVIHVLGYLQFFIKSMK